MAKKRSVKNSPSAPAPLGLASRLQSALEVFGRSDQQGFAVTHYGYLTYLHGIPDEELFLDPNTRTEATARFTFFADGKIDSRHETGNIITTSAPGQLVFFHNTKPGGDFNKPKSFSRGEPIAVCSHRYHCILNVDTGNVNVGAVSVGVDLSQLSAESFLHDGRQSQLGRKGLQLRASITGEGWLTGRDPFQAYFLYGGCFLNVEG